MVNSYLRRCNTKQSIYYSASSLYMFRVSTAPIIRCTQNCNYSLRYWSYFFVQLPPSNVAKLAVVTVFCIPDYGCGWHPKHVEWTCRIINRLLCVASLWTIININQLFFSLIWSIHVFIQFFAHFYSAAPGVRGRSTTPTLRSCVYSV